MTECKTSVIAVQKHEVIASWERGVSSIRGVNLCGSGSVKTDLNGMFLRDCTRICRSISCKEPLRDGRVEHVAPVHVTDGLEVGGIGVCGGHFGCRRDARGKA